MATATKAKGNDVFSRATCIHCGEKDVSLSLADLETVSCGACSEVFTITEVREMLSVWARICDWIDLAPTKED